MANLNSKLQKAEATRKQREFIQAVEQYIEFVKSDKYHPDAIGCYEHDIVTKAVLMVGGSNIQKELDQALEAWDEKNAR